jgi:hypothetical protein
VPFEHLLFSEEIHVKVGFVEEIKDHRRLALNHFKHKFESKDFGYLHIFCFCNHTNHDVLGGVTLTIESDMNWSLALGVFSLRSIRQH